MILYYRHGEVFEQASWESGIDDRSGDVEKAAVKSSTTDYQEFDAEIVKAVSRWKFPKTKTGGNVTIPFAFREDKENSDSDNQ